MDDNHGVVVVDNCVVIQVIVFEDHCIVVRIMVLWLKIMGF